MSTRKKTRLLTAVEQAECDAAQAIWETFKKQTGATQQATAPLLGMTQSAFAGFLSGRTALNTDFILNFSRVTGCLPSDISSRPSLKDHPALLDSEWRQVVEDLKALSDERRHNIRESIRLFRQNSGA